MANVGHQPCSFTLPRSIWTPPPTQLCSSLCLAQRLVLAVSLQPSHASRQQEGPFRHTTDAVASHSETPRGSPLPAPQPGTRGLHWRPNPALPYQTPVAAVGRLLHTRQDLDLEQRCSVSPEYHSLLNKAPRSQPSALQRAPCKPQHAGVRETTALVFPW